jgi:hypothetical protein
MRKGLSAAMSKERIPIKAARDFTKAHGLRYVVIFACGAKTSHVVTYGNTVEESGAAAELGNKMKRGLSWPEKLQAWPARVRKRNRRLAERIADSLLVNGAAEKAQRLVLEIKPGSDGGGLCRSAIVDRVEEILNRGV